MPNKQPGPFEDKKVIFATSTDPSSLKDLGGPDRVIAVMPGTPPEKVAELKAAGYSDVVLWDPSPSANTATEAKSMGVDGVILQAETPDQYSGSSQAITGLDGSGVTIAVVSNNSQPYPPGTDVAMPEAYSGTNPNATVYSVVGDTRNLGFDGYVAPVIGGDSMNQDQASAAAGYGGYGVFPADVNTTDPINSMLTAPPTEPPQSGSSRDNGIPGAPTPTGSEPVSQSASHPKPKKPAPSPGSSDPTRPPDAGDPSLGIVDKPEPAHPKPPPAPYQGGAPVEKVIHTADGGTITITATGAVIKQGPDGTAYREGWVDPDNIASIDSADDLKGQLKGGPSNPYTSSTRPAHTDASSTGGYGTSSNQDSTLAMQPAAASQNTSVSGAQTVAPSDATSWSSAVYNDQQGTTSSGGNNHGFGAVADDGSSTSTQSGASEPTSSYVPQSTPPAPATPAATTASSSDESSLDPAIAAVVKKKKQQSGGGDSSDSGGGGGVTTGGSTPDSTPDPGVSILTVDPNATGSCFAAGTPVLTPDGEKPIEEVKEGDKVQSWDFSSGQLVTSNVAKTLVHQNKATIVLTTGIGELVTTPEHRFWTGSGWTSAGKLEANSSRILDKDGDLRLVKAVKDGQSKDVYHFHVDDPHHNYFAGHLLGHNMKQLD